MTLGPAVITRREPVRQGARAQAGDAGAGLAQDRRRGRPLARADPGRDHRAVADRPADPARVPHQLQRPQLPACRPARQRGIRRRRPALLAGADEPRTADDRERSRPAQLGGLPGHRQDRQGGLQGAGDLARPGHHPARGQADRTHVDPVPDQHAGHHAADEPEVSAGPHGRHAGSGRRDEQNHRDDGEDVGADRADGGDHALDGRQDEGHDGRYRTNCATTSPISTTSSGRYATTSTGNRTASTSRSAGRSGRSSTPSTASTR